MTRSFKLLAIILSLSIALAGCSNESQQTNESETIENLEAEIVSLKEENKKLKDEIDKLEAQKIEEASKEVNKITESKEVEPSHVIISENKQKEIPNTETDIMLSTPEESIPPVPVAKEESKKDLKPSGKGKLSGFDVEVLDWKTPAVLVLGEYTGNGAFYQFYSSDEVLLGRIPDREVQAILTKYDLFGLSNEEHFDWFKNQFNIYRNINESTSESHIEEKAEDIPKDNIDYSEELLLLTNKEREREGLPDLTFDETALEYAALRAKELENSFSHGNMSFKDQSYAENIAKGFKNPEDVIKGWMKSEGHRAAILSDYSDYGNKFGAACHVGSDGTYYWTQEFLIWDANA